MTLLGGMFGAFVGFGMKVSMNALQKLPYMRHPWEHVLMTGTFAYGCHKLKDYESVQELEIQELKDFVNSTKTGQIMLKQLSSE